MIGLENVSLAFEAKRVLDRFSFTLPETGVVCLLGPSGCGKTTLIRVLAGLQPPDSGAVTGLRPGEAALLFQDDRLLGWCTARQNVAAALPRAAAGSAGDWLRRVELAEALDAYPGALSGGQRRRVALARALAYGGRLLILDEPFTGLDQALRRRLYPLVLEAAREKPVLVITHDPEEARALGTVRVCDGPPLTIA